MDPIKELREKVYERLREKRGQEGISDIPFSSGESSGSLKKKEAGSVPDITKDQLHPSDMSLAGMGIVDDPEAQQQYTQELQAQQSSGDVFTGLSKEKYIDPEAINPRAYTDNLSSQFGESVIYGTGQMIGQYGDIAQYLGSKLPGFDLQGSNSIARTLQELGADIQGSANVILPPEIENVTWSSFMDPQFWAVQGGRFAPQLTEILATMGVASLAKKGVQMGVKGLMKRELRDLMAATTEKEMLEASAKLAAKGYKGTTGAKYGMSTGINEVIGTGKGLRGLIMTDRGQLTNRFGQLIQGMTGGALMNQRVSLANAGEVYNTYNDLNEIYKQQNNGEELFTQEELGEMASQTYWNNTAYMAADMLSWSLTFGKGFDRLKSSGMGRVRQMLSKDAQMKGSSGFFSKAVMPLVSGSMRVAKKAIPEGFEETLQESWEEWSKMKAYQDVHGSMQGYQGPVSKEYGGGVGGFFDFYNSKDSESIRVISAAMGVVAGGMFNARAFFDKTGADAYKIYNRSENLKTVFRKGTEGKAMQEYNMRAQMAELVFEGKGELFGSFLQQQYDNNVINEEELTSYRDLYNHASSVYENVKDMNIPIAAKKVVMNNAILGNYYQSEIDKELDAKNKRIQLLQETIEDPKELEKAVKRENDLFEAKVSGLIQMVATTEDNVQNILKGKPAKELFPEVTVDEFGNEQFVMGDPNQGTNQEEFIDEEEVGVNVETGEEVPQVKPKSGSITDSIKKRMKGLKDLIMGKQPVEENPTQETSEEENAKSGIEAEVDGAIESLGDGNLLNTQSNPTNQSESSLRDQAGEVPITSAVEAFDTSTPGDEFLMNTGQKSDPSRGNETQGGATFQEEAVIRTEKGFMPVSDIEKEDTDKTKREYSPADLDKNNESVRFYKNKPKTKTESNPESNSESKTNNEPTSIKETAKSAGIELNEDEEAAVSAILDEESDSDSESSSEETSEQRSERIKSETLEADPTIPNPFEKRESTKSSKKKTFSITDKLNKKNRFRSMFPKKSRIKNLRTYNDESANFVDRDLMKISQMIAVNQRLSESFPGNQKPSVYIVDSLYQKYGVRALGYTIAGAAYIRGDRWDQDDVFMHEMAHIYFQMTENTPETKNFLKYALKNKKLVDYVKELYWNQEIVKVNTSDGGFYVSPIYQIEELSGLSKNQVDEVIDGMSDIFERIPQENQFIWNEEVFTHTLEGTLSSQYNKFFNPQLDATRQMNSKRWWNSIKGRFTKSNQEEQSYSERDLLNILSGGELESYNSSRQHIMEQFRNGIKEQKASFSILGRAKLSEEEQQSLDRQNLISDELKESIRMNHRQRNKNVDSIYEIEEGYDERYENPFESNLKRADDKISQLLRSFSNTYNKALGIKFFKEGHNDKSKRPVFDSDNLKITLYQLANQATSSEEFIDLIQESNIPEIKAFNSYLNTTRGKNADNSKGDKEMLLQSTFWVNKNKSYINGVQSYVNKNNQLKIMDSRNSKEVSSIENAVSAVTEKSYARLNKLQGLGFNKELDQEFEAFSEASERIKNNPVISKEDIQTVVDYFAPYGLRTDKIVDENRIIVAGKTYPLHQVISSLIRSQKGMNVNPNPKNEWDKLSNYGIRDNSKKDSSGTFPIKDSYRSFIEALVISNRKYSVNETVLDSTKNQNPVLITDNYFTRSIKKMEVDAKTLTEDQFIKKHSHVNLSGKGSLSNNLLKHFYKVANKDLNIPINQNFGTQDDSMGTATNFPDSSSEEQRINELLYFAATRNQSKGTYLMDAGRFADSSRAFMMEVPLIPLSEAGKFEGNKIKFLSKASSIFESAYQTYSKLNKSNPVSKQEFYNQINNLIQKQIQFVEDRPETFNRIDKTQKWFGQDGKLNNEGKAAIAEMEMNNIFNGIYFNEAFLPSYQMNLDRDKRAKQLASPYMSLGENVKMQTIYFVDPNVIEGDSNSGDITDGVAYMLADPEDDNFNDIKRISQMGGNMIDLGNSLKMIGTGIEYENEAFKGKNIYDKPKVSPLNEAIVLQQPRLRPLYERMRAERQKYLDSNNGVLEDNLLSGKDSQVLWAVSLSSNKSKLLPNEFNHSDFTLENINNEAVSAVLDKWYYKDGKFSGLSGDMYGIQTVMDKETYESILPVQLLQSLITNADLNDNFYELQEITQDITNQMQKNFKETYDVFTKGSKEDILEFMKKEFSMDSMDPKQRDLILDGMSLSIPALRTIALNTISNTVRRTSNKLTTAGAIAHSTPSLYEKDYGYTNGSRELQYRQERQTVKSDGTVEISYSKGEAVVPKHLSKKLRKRSFLIVAPGGAKYNTIGADIRNMDKMTLAEFVKNSESLVSQEARRRGVGYGAVYNPKNSTQQIGWYVEGDTILATRIPSHGVQTTGVFEVVDFNASDSDEILLPSEFIQIIGGDHDGDAIFINHKERGKGSWNRAFDGVVDHLMSPKMHNEVMQRIDYTEEAKKAVSDTKKVYGKVDDDNVIATSSEGREISSDNTLGTKGLVGIAANMNTRLNAMRAYNIGFADAFSIDGKQVNSFQNDPTRSLGISSSKVMNLILDNSKNPFARNLAINDQTIGHAMILTNLKFDLSQIGIIMNSPAYKSYVRAKSNSYNGKNKVKLDQKVREILKSSYQIEAPKLTDSSIKVSTKDNVLSPENQASILNLISVLEGINKDILTLNSIMSGHSNLERNVFVLNENLTNFKNVLENNGNNQLVINDAFRMDPIVLNYIKTAEHYTDIANRIDPTSNITLAKMYNEIVVGSVNLMNNSDKYELQNNFEVNNAAVAMSLNNVPSGDMESLIRPSTKNNPNPDNIFERLNKVILDKTIIDKKNIDKSISGRNSSLLFSKGLHYSLKGNAQYISLSDSFYSKKMSNVERDALIEEFNSLDPKLIKDLMLYDLFTHQWKGSQTMFPLFSLEYKKKVSEKIDVRNKSNPSLSELEYDNLMKAIIAKNHSKLKTIYLTKKDWPNPKKFPLGTILSKNKDLYNQVLKGVPTFFKYKNPYGNYEKIVYFPGFNSEQEIEVANEMNPSRKNSLKAMYVSENILKSIEGGKSNIFSPDNSTNYIKIITANSSSTNTTPSSPKPVSGNSNSTNFSEALNNAKNQIQGRAKKDPYMFKGKLDRAQFDIAMEYQVGVPESTKELLYNEYKSDKKNADVIFKQKVNPETLKSMSTEDIWKIYGSKNDIGDGQKGYGYRNLYAYSEVNDAIQKELFNRISNEQEAITGRRYTGEDISPIKKFFMSNNIPSNHPAVQGLVRRMEGEYKSYIKERKKYMDQINDVTNELYQEQWGIKTKEGGLLNTLKTIYHSLFSDRKKFYEKLYGPLIVHETILNEAGESISNMRYKTEEEVELGFKNGEISAAQKKFYEVTKGITDHLKQYNLDETNPGRAGYIPHTAPSLLETFSRRGMLGLFVQSKTVDERINDVVMSFKNPITGEMDKGNFKQIRDIYNVLSKSENGIKSGLEFAKLKRKAISLARQGKNEDGSDLRLSNAEIGSALGDIFMERFSASRSRSSADFPSLDLNKAFSDYVSGTMFTNGNENFGGFKKMLPIVDGVLTHLKSNGNTNMAEYVDKIWKQYFLAGSKQKSGIYNTKTLETLGITTDDTIDYLTKASLLYWLGYKGLAISGGVYALGNVLVGKYKNIVNNGGEAWKKGESRFWGTDEGFNLNTFGPRKANEILKKVGFMDINVYDDVNVETKNSFEKTLTNFALSPMIASERWIQGVQFLGLLTDEEWESVKNGSDLDSTRLREIEEEIKRSQGKGYQVTDQRMIQMYSWGRNMMQFNRYLPTMLYELASPRDIDRYGKEHIGTYRLVYEGIQKTVMGLWSPKKFVEYRKGLSDSERRRMDYGLMGFGLLSILAATGIGGKTSNDLFWDSNAVFDLEKISMKMTPASVNMVDNVIF